ncbi:Proteasome subunit beta type-7 [Coniosporium tulheliwenetii]|uniref:Proteasome subunit beta type-7 n=1 Tax=Coniosporium tulheliwenetii TaxID=3383036 RepID=A0ACC2YYM8_9PEZI|nr:Proteasome subunit beta type-7 [Cladosporium sp. JES 115]
MNHLPQAWGRPRDDIYGAYDHSHFSSDPSFRDGVVLAADNLASYGSLARFTDVKRIRKFNDKAVLGFGGDVSDMQCLDRHLNALAIRENYSSSASASSDKEAAASAEGAVGQSHNQEGLDDEGQGTDMAANNLHKYF